jgi:hypothetical protein
MAVGMTVSRELIGLSEGRQCVMVPPQIYVIFHESLSFNASIFLGDPFGT